MGFVSNSSSSSFCIYGSQFDDAREELGKKLIESIKEEYIKEELNGEEFDEDNFEEYLDDVFYDRVYETAEEAGLEYYSPNDCGTYIGKSLSECKDDQTMGDFKKEVADLINKTFGKTPDLGVHSMEWYDG